MKTKFFSILITFCVVTSVFSQTNLNEYKYVIVTNRYDFLKEADQYQLNSLTKFLFEKYGFQSLMEGGNYPEDLIRNRCLALKSDVLKDSGLFKTKLNIELKDCNDRVVYTSEVGESREKEYAKAYNESLRAAFKSFESVNYKYEPKENSNVVSISNVETKNEVANEIQQLKEEIQNLKKEKETEAVLAVGTKPVSEKIIETPIKKVESIDNDSTEVVSDVLYAQAIENGFQLVDSSPKVVYKIKKTGLSNVFLIEGKNAILHKKEDQWILEFYENNILKQEPLNIKF